MISIEQINGEIASLEEEKPTYQIMERLANLYVVRDHLIIGNQSKDPVAVAAQTAHIDSQSEFAKAVEGKCVEDIMPLFDELMTALLALNPRLDECVMRKL